MKASYFRISKPLCIENLRRFGPVSLVAFLAYALSGILPILLNYNRLTNSSAFINALLTNTYPVYWMISLIAPVVAAVLVFQYLQKSSLVTAMHALPFTRSKLFNSSVLSGFLLCAVPVILTGIILLAVAKPVFVQNDELVINFFSTDVTPPSDVNIFSAGDILTWLWQQLLLVFAAYTISILAGILTGSRAIHCFTAIWFNFLGIGLYGVITGYFNLLLYGYKTGFGWLAPYFSPFVGIIYTSMAARSAYAFAIYFLLGIGILILSAFLYKKRKLERAGRGLAFPPLEPVLCYLLAFFGMTGVGFVFHLSIGTRSAFYLGLVGGGVLFFLIARMIVKKTFRVFNLASLKHLGIFALLSIVFVATVGMDLTGFQKRVPQPSQVTSVAITTAGGSSMTGDADRFDSSNFKGGSSDGLFICREKANIQTAIQIHKEILKKHPVIKQTDLDNVDSFYADFNYALKGALNLKRQYVMKNSLMKSFPSMKTIYESREFKNFFSLKNLNIKGSLDISMQSPLGDGISIDNKDRPALLRCLEKDFQASTYEQEFLNKDRYATAAFEYDMTTSEGNTTSSVEVASLNIDIHSSDIYTTRWLKAHGYYNTLTASARNVESVLLFNDQQDSSDYDTLLNELAGGQTGIALVKDKKEIARVISSIAPFAWSDGQYYAVFRLHNGTKLNGDGGGNGSSGGYMIYKEDLPASLKGKI